MLRSLSTNTIYTTIYLSLSYFTNYTLKYMSNQIFIIFRDRDNIFLQCKIIFIHYKNDMIFGYQNSHLKKLLVKPFQKYKCVALSFPGKIFLAKRGMIYLTFLCIFISLSSIPLQ